MTLDDPDLPECLRMDPPPSSFDNATTLQRTMSMVSLGDSTQEHPPTQVVSMSDDDLEPVQGDWAEQMQQESDDRNLSGRVSF